jgi:hypothetical protein
MRLAARMYIIHTSPYSVLLSASSFDLGGFSSELWVLKDELVDCDPTSIRPVAATEVLAPRISAGTVLVESFDSKDELAELTRASKASRSARRASMNLSYAANTSSLSFFAS